jgi:SNF2 family DNA or RNA helicase
MLLFLQHRDPNLEFDVLVTSFELALKDVHFLKIIPFKLCIIDEAHRLKVRSRRTMVDG